MADHVRAPGLWIACGPVRTLFKMWHGYTKAEKCKFLKDTMEELQAEVERLEQLAEPETSIWRAKKEQLEEVAIEELEMTRAQAEKHLVPILRQ